MLHRLHLLLLSLSALLLLRSAVDAVQFANRCPEVAFIMHTNEKEDFLTTFSSQTFLANVSLLVMTGHDVFPSALGFPGDNVGSAWRRRLDRREPRKLLRVSYNGNPGTYGMAFVTNGAKYRGVTRPMAGLLIAHDTFPAAKWFYIFDDDNYIAVDEVCKAFNKLNPAVPLLLAGQIGPKSGGHAPCTTTNTKDHWSCCLSAAAACRAYTAGTTAQSVWRWDETLRTMTPRPCDKKSCHQTVPWPEGMAHGFPYRLRHPASVVDREPHHAVFAPHHYSLFPYGGGTYGLSKGMLDAIGRDAMELGTYGIQWENADLAVMQVVFNAGYSITALDPLVMPHHVKSVESMILAGLAMGDREPLEVRRVLCARDAANVATDKCLEVCPDCPQFAGRGLRGGSKPLP